MARFHARRPMQRAGSFTSKSWIFDSGSSAGLSSGTKELVSSIAVTEGTDATVLRNYLNWSISVVGAYPPDGFYQVGLGIAIVSDIAAAQAASAGVPSPITNGDSDLWLLHTVKQLVVESSQNAGFITFDHELKVKRKMGDGENMVLVVEMADNAASSNIRFALRTLLMIK